MATALRAGASPPPTERLRELAQPIGSSVVTGIINLSAPVFDHRGAPVAALTVPYVAQRYAHTPVEAGGGAAFAVTTPAPSCDEAGRLAFAGRFGLER